MRFREKLARFMQGRYGADQFGFFLLIINVVIVIVSWFVRETPAYYVLWGFSLLLIATYIWRVFSKKTDKRAKENRVFLKIITKIKEFFIRQFNRVRYIGKYRYRKCKNCKTFLRLPLKRGRHKVRCPKCGSNFDVNIVL